MGNFPGKRVYAPSMCEKIDPMPGGGQQKNAPPQGRRGGKCRKSGRPLFRGRACAAFCASVGRQRRPIRRSLRRSVKKICQWHIFSVGRSGYAARKPCYRVAAENDSHFFRRLRAANSARLLAEKNSAAARETGSSSLLFSIQNNTGRWPGPPGGAPGPHGGIPPPRRPGPPPPAAPPPGPSGR